MIRMQDQKRKQKKNKYVKHNKKIQKAKKIGGAIAGSSIVVIAGAKEATKHAPEIAKVAAQIGKTVAKL